MADMKTKDYVPDDVRIIVNPDLIYILAQKNRRDLYDGRVCVAESKNDSYCIYITLTDDLMSLQFDVMDGDDLVHSYPIEDAEDCLTLFWSLVSDYLTEDTKYVNEQRPPTDLKDQLDKDNNPLSDDEMDDLVSEIMEREDALAWAFSDFLAVVLDCSPADLPFDSGDNEFMDLLDDVLEVIGSDHELDVYRPTIVDGTLSEYPYSEVAPEDPDMPPEDTED